MSAGKFGLLKGLGDGLAQTGNMMMVDKLDQMKQERLQAYQTKMQDRQFARDDVTRAEDRKNQVEDRDLNQENTNRQFGLLRDQFAADRSDTAFNQNLQTENLGMDRERLDLTRQQLQQTIELGNLSLDEGRRLEGLYSTIANPDSSEEQISGAIATLQNLKNTDPEKYSAITLYGEDDGSGYQPRTSGVLSSRTGRVAPVGQPSPSAQGGYQSPEDVRSAFRNGDISRDEATRLLQGF